MTSNTTIGPTEARKRKAVPIATGLIDYFPLAIKAIAKLSFIGNDQHNPGKPLHWDRSKSGDESDALMRHFVDRGTLDSDGVPHSVKVAWRALALVQKEAEAKPDVYRAFFNDCSSSPTESPIPPTHLQRPFAGMLRRIPWRDQAHQASDSDDL